MDPDPASLNTIAVSFSDLFFTFGPVTLVLVIFLFLSAFISGTEVAFFSLSHPEREDFREEAGRVWELLSRPKRLLATILIFNNLVNVAIILLASLTLSQMSERYGWKQEAWAEYVIPVIEVGIITFILLFFGEITPKVYASQNRLRFVRLVALPMIVFRTAMSPISWFLIRSTSFLDRRIKEANESASFEDIKQAIDLTSEEESPEEEKGILKGIVNFSSTQVKAIIRARVDVIAVDITMPLEELVDLINSAGYSRMPVYEDSLDSIKGILYVKDLLPFLKGDNTENEWQSLIRPAYFIPEQKKIDDLLDEFKSRRLHIAIVVDEFGGTAGLVTLEDIIEEIFGEIVDEFDDEELIFSKLSESMYVFDGKMPLNDIFRITEIPDSSFEEVRGDADTLAGLILEICGRIPVIGDVIPYENFRFYVESVTQRRIKRIKIEILDDVPETI